MSSPYRKPSTPYIPQGYSHGERQPQEGRSRENVGTRWGRSAPKLQERQFAAEKFAEVENRARRVRRDKQGQKLLDWQQKTIVEPGQEYAVYGSGTYRYHGHNPSTTLHGGGKDSKASALKKKKRDDQFKAATVQAGQDRDYHEAQMRRGHCPTDRSDASLKSPMHPDASQAQRDWEMRRRLNKSQNTHNIHISNQRPSNACPVRKTEVTARVIQDKHHELAEEAAFRAEMIAKASRPAPQAPLTPPSPIERDEPVASGVVEDSSYPTGLPSASPTPPSPEEAEAPGLHSRYAGEEQQEEEQYPEEFEPCVIPHAGPWGPHGPMHGAYPFPADVPYGYDLSRGAAYGAPVGYPGYGGAYPGASHRRSYPGSRAPVGYYYQ